MVFWMGHWKMVWKYRKGDKNWKSSRLILKFESIEFINNVMWRKGEIKNIASIFNFNNWRSWIAINLYRKQWKSNCFWKESSFELLQLWTTIIISGLKPNKQKIADKMAVQGWCGGDYTLFQLRSARGLKGGSWNPLKAHSALVVVAVGQDISWDCQHA